MNEPARFVRAKVRAAGHFGKMTLTDENKLAAPSRGQMNERTCDAGQNDLCVELIKKFRSTRETSISEFGHDILGEYSDDQLVEFYTQLKGYAESKPGWGELQDDILILSGNWKVGPTDPTERMKWAYETARERQSEQQMYAFARATQTFFSLLIWGAAVVAGPYLAGTVEILGDNPFEVLGRVIGRWLSGWPVIIGTIIDAVRNWLGL